MCFHVTILDRFMQVHRAPRLRASSMAAKRQQLSTNIAVMRHVPHLLDGSERINNADIIFGVQTTCFFRHNISACMQVEIISKSGIIKQAKHRGIY